MEITCPCGTKVIVTTPSRIGRTKYCSKKCFYQYHGRRSGLKYKIVNKNPTWFPKGHKIGIGRHPSLETIEKMRRSKIGKRVSIATEFTRDRVLGEKNNKWKGDGVDYYALHSWIIRKYGKASICEQCGSKNRVQWASKNYKYTRDREDWLNLCNKCHRRYDSKNGWGVATKLFPILRGVKNV